MAGRRSELLTGFPTTENMCVLYTNVNLNRLLLVLASPGLAETSFMCGMLVPNFVLDLKYIYSIQKFVFVENVLLSIHR